MDISFDKLIDYGVSRNYIKTSTKRYRQGKSLSWSNKKDPTDGRKILIDIDSIPEATRKKYNIPTGLEYYELQEVKRIETEEKRKKLASELRTNSEKEALYNSYHSDYLKYMPLYQKHFSYSDKHGYEIVKQMAQNHAFWVAMVSVTGNKYKVNQGGNKRGFELYTELKSELNYKRSVNNENGFRILLWEIRKNLLEDKCISSLVVGKKMKAKAPIKTNEFHRGITMAFLSHPNKYCYRIVTDLVNHHCLEENQPEITESWVKWIMVKDNHFRTLVMASRNGEKYTKDNLIAHAVRKNTAFPANVWMIDGSPMQFYCWNESRTKTVRLNLFVVIDVCSRKIVGFDVSYHEDRFNIMNALKMAVMEQGHLPAEIVSDNFSASKTPEIKALVEQMGKLGTVWRHAKVGNPQDKSYVERFFGSLQSTEQALYDDYIGEGIMSKRDNRRNAEQMVETSKKDGFPTFNQMKDRAIAMIITYNQREKSNRKAPKEVYNSLPKPNAKELDSVRTALLFWKRTKVTAGKQQIRIIVNKQEHFYEIYDHKHSAELQGKQVYVRYDETDLERIMLFDVVNENVICECRASIKIATGYADRTDEDLENMHKVVAKQKSYKNYLETENENTVQDAVKTTKKEVFKGKHPMGLAKNQIHDLEDLAQQERLRQSLNIPKDQEQKIQKEPLFVVENKENKVDYMDIIEEKKPKKGFDKATLAVVDK